MRKCTKCSRKIEGEGEACNDCDKSQINARGYWVLGIVILIIGGLLGGSFFGEKERNIDRRICEEYHPNNMTNCMKCLRKNGTTEGLGLCVSNENVLSQFSLEERTYIENLK